jgi:microcystin-dependent protein
MKRRTKSDSNFFVSWPAGFIIPTGRLDINVPEGLLWCNGAAVGRADFPELFAEIDVDWGAGNGTTTYNIPNLKGMTLIGRNSADPDFWNLGQTGGLKDVGLIGAENGNHLHGVPRQATALVSDFVLDFMGGGNNWDNASTRSTSSSGSGTVHENLPPFKIVNFFITAGRRTL